MGEAEPVAVTGLPVVGVAVTVKLVLPLPAVKVMLAEFDVTVLLDTEPGAEQEGGVYVKFSPEGGMMVELVATVAALELPAVVAVQLVAEVRSL